MLIIQKMEVIKLSSNEEIIKNFILENKEQLKNLTLKQIAAKIYVSPAALVVFAKKMGYSGWNEFKEDFILELQYLNSHFQQIDANIPFNSQDNIMKIANKIGTLQKETIDDTLTLLDHDSLQQALTLIKNCSAIYLFGTSMSYIAAQEFSYAMKRLGMPVEFCLDPIEQVFQTHTLPSDALAIIISYTGETAPIVNACQILQKRKIATITITSIGDNTINKYSDVSLYLCTRENVHSKISSFSSRQSIHTILDILYSCYFAFNYQNNYQKTITMNKTIELKRYSSNTKINQ